MYTYIPRGVCSRAMNVELDGNKIKNIEIIGGCSGNTQGVAALAIGMDAEEYIKRCGKIRCGSKPTSCPAQLAIAVREALNAQNQ